VTSPLVHPHDPAWIERFRELADWLSPCLEAGAIGIEHFGSTSVPGLAAKPVIDIHIVIPSGGFAAVCRVLETLGYEHRGDQGVEQREVFKLIDPEASGPLPTHHLYVCEEGCPPLRSHRMFRDFLRSRPDLVQDLSAAKMEAAERAEHDRKRYQDLKSPAYATVVAQAILALDL